MRRRVLVVALVVALLVGAGAAAKVVWDHAHRTDFSTALGTVSSQTQRFSFTDWAAVRTALQVPDSADPEPKAVGAWLRRAYQRDLSAASSINDSGAALQRLFGFSPGNARWEGYAQAEQGSAMVLRLEDDVDFGRVADALASAGFTKPSSDTGVWKGGADLVATLDPSLTPELQYVVLLSNKHLVVSSDSEAYVVLAAEVANGKGGSLADVADTRDLVGRLAEPAAAILWAHDFACTDLAMSQADEGDQKQAEQLIARAGKVSPLSGLVMALTPQRNLIVAEQFDSSSQAADNLKARAILAVGEAVGRGESTFADDFKLTSAKAVGSTVLLEMHPRDPTAFVLSSVYDGPVIFATC